MVFKKISLHSVLNHMLKIIQRLSQCLPFPESLGFLAPSEEVIISWCLPSPDPQGFLNCCSFTPGAPGGYHSTFTPSPKSPDLPIWCSFLGAQEISQSPLLLVGIRLLLGMTRNIPYPVAIPGRSWSSLQWVQLGLGPMKNWNTSLKRVPEYHQVARPP